MVSFWLFRGIPGGSKDDFLRGDFWGMSVNFLRISGGFLGYLQQISGGFLGNLVVSF